MNRLLESERDLGSQAGTGVPTEVVGIRGAQLILLPTGNYALISDAKLPPDETEVLAILTEFVPLDWSCYEETAEEDRDVAYYGPDDWSPTREPAVPRPRGAV